VKGVIVLLDELISQIRSDQARRSRKQVDEPLLMNISQSTIEHKQSTSDHSGQFVPSQLLIDYLPRVKSTTIDKYGSIFLPENDPYSETAQQHVLSLNHRLNGTAENQEMHAECTAQYPPKLRQLSELTFIPTETVKWILEHSHDSLISKHNDRQKGSRYFSWHHE
jgi:hypothetical protein